MSDETLIGNVAPQAGTPPASGTPPSTPPVTTAAATPPGTEQTPPDPSAKPPGDGASAPIERAAPEKYEFKLPQGVALDSEILGQFEGAARELKMPQAEAQQLVEKLAPKITERFAKQMADSVSRISDEWSTAAKTDKEFGGPALAENLAISEKALATFATPELSKLLKETRIGNNPEFIRFTYRVGKALSEDGFVGGRDVPQKKSDLQVMYPTMFKE